MLTFEDLCFAVDLSEKYDAMLGSFNQILLQEMCPIESPKELHAISTCTLTNKMRILASPQVGHLNHLM